MIAFSSVVGALWLVAGLVAEGLVRVIDPQQLILIRPDLWEPADTIGWRRRSNASVRINTGERTVTVRTDREGFRVGSVGRREAATRVLLVGDSFMEALQVEHEQSTAYLLECELERLLQRPVVVRNAGVSDWGPNHYVLRTRQLLARDSYALIVVAIFVGNDAIDARVHAFPPRQPAQRRHFALPREATWRAVVQSTLAPVNDALEVRSHLFILLRRSLATLRMRLGMTADYFPRDMLRAEAATSRWRVTASAARELSDLATARGIPVLFVLIPDRLQVSPEDLERHLRGFGIDRSAVDLTQPSVRLAQALADESLMVLDALPAFRTAASASPPLFGRVDQHLTPEGHRILSSAVAPRAATLVAR